MSITIIIFTIINMIIEMVRYYRDTYAEHPEDRKNIEYSVSFQTDDLVLRWKLGSWQCKIDEYDH